MAELNARYVLIGGGVASAFAAEAIRKEDRDGSILIVGDEDRVPYNRPPLTKEYLRGEAGPKDVIVHPVEWYRDQRVGLVLGRKATEIDISAQTIRIENGDRIRYEKLLLATGARPVRPSIPGIDLPNVQLMRRWGDSDALKPYMKKRIAIIGGGYIGLEVSAGSAQDGGKPVILERSSRIMGRSISPELSRWFADRLEQAGVQIEFNVEVEAITPSGVAVKGGKFIEADHVLVAAGVEPNIELARAAGIAIDDEHQGVLVDEYLAASVPNVWAAGDIASFYDPVFDKRWRVEHYNNAQWQGEIAGANMAGLRKPFDKVENFFSYELDIQFELFGDPQGGRHALFHGDPSTNRFDELYVNESGQVVMVVSINPPEDLYPVLEQLPRVKPKITGRESEISRGNFDLKTLLD